MILFSCDRSFFEIYRLLRAKHGRIISLSQQSLHVRSSKTLAAYRCRLLKDMLAPFNLARHTDIAWMTLQSALRHAPPIHLQSHKEIYDSRTYVDCLSWPFMSKRQDDAWNHLTVKQVPPTVSG
ncbi:hypothetical protein AcV7_006918 [Taiwanofungus camphoratus]|nr:hypothetical protein AcV7_006918 [Antrodia cinnamomea]